MSRKRADRPSGAPEIGRVDDVQQGHVRADVTLRPPAVALDGTSAGAFHVAAASLIGAGNLQSGTPRQDAYNFMAGRSGRLYVAIADGVGSASQLGAHLWAESVLFAATRAEEHTGTSPDPARLLVEAGKRMAEIVSGTYGLEPRLASCVGAVAVFDDRGCAIARVGDVSAFTVRDGEFTEAFDAPAKAPAAMPGQDAKDIEVVELGPEPIVVFGTGGLANDIRNSDTLREWLAEHWRRPHLPFAIGDTLRYRRQGSHDDRTAVLVWRDAGPGDKVSN